MWYVAWTTSKEKQCTHSCCMHTSLIYTHFIQCCIVDNWLFPIHTSTNHCSTKGALSKLTATDTTYHIIAKVPLERYFSYYIIGFVHMYMMTTYWYLVIYRLVAVHRVVVMYRTMTRVVTMYRTMTRVVTMYRTMTRVVTMYRTMTRVVTMYRTMTRVVTMNLMTLVNFP